MSGPEKFIVEQIKAGNFLLTIHARKRMGERFVTDLDIIEVAKTLKSIRYQKKNDTYLLTGVSTWVEKLMVSAAIRHQVIIVTVFWEN